MKQGLFGLARFSGQRTWDQPFSPWPSFDAAQIQATVDVLRSGKVNYWTGEQGRCFEEEYAEFVGVPYAIALANGTLALELALYGLEIGPGDEVVVPCRTFLASASAVVARGATPVMADVDPQTQNLTAETVERVLSPRTKAVIAVHLAGCPCEMDPLLELARKRGLKVIEDCAQAHGAMYKNRPVGSLGDVAAFSFCQDKILTTGGEGGLLTTSDPDLWRRCWSYKDHGKDYDAVQSPSSRAVFKWVHHSFGTNWRLTEMQAAIGREVLQRLPEWVEQRRRNAATLTDGLQQMPGLRVPEVPPHLFHSYYKFYAFLDLSTLQPGWTRDEVVLALQDEGIPCGSGSCPEIYLERAFDSPGLRPKSRLPVAKMLGETSLMFLVHPTLKPEELQATVDAVAKVLNVAQRQPLVRGKAA